MFSQKRESAKFTVFPATRSTASRTRFIQRKNFNGFISDIRRPPPLPLEPRRISPVDWRSQRWPHQFPKAPDRGDQAKSQESGIRRAKAGEVTVKAYGERW